MKTSLFSVMAMIAGLLFCLSTASADLEIGASMYTTHGFYVEKGKSYTTNYRAGVCIPRGSKVTVIEVKSRYANVLVDHFNTKKVRIINPQRHSKMTTDQYLNRMLSKEPQTLSKYSKSKRDAIKHCRPVVGMTKDEVIAAVGYPPAHVTPSTDMNQWKYWKKRFNTEVHYFLKNKLETIED